jgi:hypothetical protein
MRQVTLDLKIENQRLRDAIARAKAIDPYAGAGARGAGLLGSDAISEYARAYRDAIHDALELTSPKTGAKHGA